MRIPDFWAGVLVGWSVFTPLTLLALSWFKAQCDA
ncbi:hypothetical protein J2X45_001698 [Caulobacter sp. BE264]|nr:hypothetical protein [Caulobacter sp. BE264]